MNIQHQHLDTKLHKWIGEEHQLKEWPQKTVDGFIKQENIIVEFLGSDVHGHPLLWEHDYDATDRIGRNMQSNYGDTSEKLSKLKSLGYRVFYVWDVDVDRKTGKSLLPEFYREFIEHLEW